MIKRFKLTVLGMVILAAATLPVILTGQVSARIDEDSKNAACAGIQAAGQSCDEAAAEGSIDSLVEVVVNILSWVVGVASIIMLIVGGLRYVISNGDANSISSAKNTILYALIGVAIAVLAQAIIRFVLFRTA